MKNLVVALSLSISVGAFGQIPGTVVDYSNDPIYKKTIIECSVLGPLQLEWESLKSSWNTFDIVALWNFSSGMNFYRNKGVSPQMRAQLDSDAFYAALNQCYPNNELAQSSFMLALITNDIRGTFGGAILAYYLWPSKVLKSIKLAHPVGGRILTGTLVSLASIRAVQAWRDFFSESKKLGNEQVEKLTVPPQNEAEEIRNSVFTLLDNRIQYLKYQLKNPNLSEERKKQITQEIDELENQKLNNSMALD